MINNTQSTCPYCGANLKLMKNNTLQCEFCRSIYPTVPEQKPTHQNPLFETKKKRKKNTSTASSSSLILVGTACFLFLSVFLSVLFLGKQNEQTPSTADINAEIEDINFSPFFSEIIPAMYGDIIIRLTPEDFERLIRFEYSSNTLTYQLKGEEPQTISVNDYPTASPEDLVYFPNIERLSWYGAIYGKMPALPNLKELHVRAQLDTILNICQNPDKLEILDMTSYDENLEELAQFTNLKELHLSLTRVESIESIQYLTNLTSLTLNCSNISSFDTQPVLNTSALKACTNLKELHIKNCEMKNFSFLKELPKLTTLELNNTQILTLDVLKNNKKIKKLILDGNETLEDCKAIDTLTGLEHLEFSIPDESQTPTFKKLSKLTHLKIGAVSADNFDFLKNAKNINYLDIRVWGDDVTPYIAKLKKLRHLKLEVACWHSYYDTIHFENLYSLKNLKTLDLSGSDMDIELSPVFSIPSLRELNLNNCTFIELDFQKIKTNKNLKILRMDNTDMGIGNNLDVATNLSFLRKLPNLQELSLANYKITSLSEISKLKNLKVLNVQGNYITNFKPLKKLKHLEKVICGNNATSENIDLGKGVTVITSVED